MARREISTLNTPQQYNQPVSTCWHDQTMARREVSTLHTSQQYNQPVPTCWHDQTMARRKVSTLRTSQQHNQPVPTCFQQQWLNQGKYSGTHPLYKAQQQTVPSSWLTATSNGSNSRACTSHTSYDYTTTGPKQLKAQREVSTLQTAQQHNQQVPTCWHDETMA